MTDARKATISRNTNETQIEVSLNLDWSPSSGVKQAIDVQTGIGFLDHVRFPSQDLCGGLELLVDVQCFSEAWRNGTHDEVQR